jgi:hypothetical protein
MRKRCARAADNVGRAQDIASGHSTMTEHDDAIPPSDESLAEFATARRLSDTANILQLERSVRSSQAGVSEPTSRNTLVPATHGLPLA